MDSQRLGNVGDALALVASRTAYGQLAVPTRPRASPEDPALSDRRLSYRLWTAVSSSTATSRLLLELRAVYEEVAAALGHEPGGMEHAVWRFKSRAV